MLWDANGVVHFLGSGLRHALGDGVLFGASFGLVLRYIVGAGLGLGDHFANLVGARLLLINVRALLNRTGALFGASLAHGVRVRNFFVHALVGGDRHFPGFAGGHPDTLANRFGHRSATTTAATATAATTAGYFMVNRLPVAAVDRHRFHRGDRNTLGYRTRASHLLGVGNTYRVGLLDV